MGERCHMQYHAAQPHYSPDGVSDLRSRTRSMQDQGASNSAVASVTRVGLQAVTTADDVGAATLEVCDE